MLDKFRGLQFNFEGVKTMPKKVSHNLKVKLLLMHLSILQYNEMPSKKGYSTTPIIAPSIIAQTPIIAPRLG